jgi:uncharacterized membrane protein YeaQ/YmgE (transglycosylase-associated protein family)
VNVVGAILIGLVIGLIARFLTPGPTPGGLIVTTVVGIVGSVLATLAGQAAGWYDNGQRAGFLGSIVGAVAFLLVLRALSGRGHRSWRLRR